MKTGNSKRPLTIMEQYISIKDQLLSIIEKCDDQMKAYVIGQLEALSESLRNELKM